MHGEQRAFLARRIALSDGGIPVRDVCDPPLFSRLFARDVQERLVPSPLLRRLPAVSSLSFRNAASLVSVREHCSRTGTIILLG